MQFRRRRLLFGILVLALAAQLLPSALAALPGSAQVADTTAAASTGKVTPPAGPLPPENRALATALQTGRRTEVPELRTETSEFFVNPDGTKTMNQHPMPVRVRRGAGWVVPDPTLRRRPDGSIQPVATVSPITLSGGGGSSLLTIGKPGARVTLGWPGRLPAPRLQGDTAIYPAVLPGVDLKIEVGVDNFSYLLVVKNHAAALNPELRSLRTLLRTEGLDLTLRPDGTTVAADGAGESVFTAGRPAMWDSAPADSGQQSARVGVRLAKSTDPSYGKEFQLAPDRAMLTDPGAKFPLYIDPSLSGAMVRWLHVNENMGNQTGWGYDTGQGAKVGRAYGDTDNLYQSMFQVATTNGLQTIAGATVTAASFRITLDHTPTGTATPVDLWHIKDLDPGVVINWGNAGSYWREKLQQVKAESYPPPEDKAVEFNAEPLRVLLQSVADSRATSVSFGLRAPDESRTAAAQDQWKKFFPNTAGLSVTYNNAPRAPKSLNMTRPTACGTAQSPVPISTATPQFSAVANDPDTGDNVTTTVQVLDPAGAVAFQSDVGPTVSGAAFSWPNTPAGLLSEGVVYHYRAISRDRVTTGPATPDCYFVVDTLGPAVPVIESTDFPEDEANIGTWKTGTVTFRPGGGVPGEVAEYVYGFAKEKMTMRVKADVDGHATIPMTLWPNPGSSLGSKSLFVSAVDVAGNPSDVRPGWYLRAYASTKPTTVRADSNGDGQADVAAVFDQGNGRTTVWNVTSAAGGGFHTGYIGWDTREGGGYPLNRIRPMQGDFDGDGKADMALFREGAGRQIWLGKLTSDGNRYDSPQPTWTSGPNGWPLSTVRALAGDVDGDGKSDVIAQVVGVASDWQVQVFTAAGGFAKPVSWAKSAAGNLWERSAPVLADIDGDKKADLVSMRNMTGCRTVVEMYRSTGTAFAPAQTIYDSGAGNYCWEKSKPVVADVDGDHKDDIVSLYEYAADDAGLRVFRSTGTTLTESSWWRATNALDLSKATLVAGDYNSDGKEDTAVLYACCTTGQRQMFTFASTGTAFGAKTQSWAGQVDAVTGPKFDIEHRTYDLVNRNSGKCLNVEQASTANLARYIQYQCLPVDLNARFRLDAIAGTDQYSVRPMHSVKCADVDNWGQQDGAQVLQWPCGNGNGEATANQQVTIEYVDGSSYDTVVQLRFAHSGKCATVAGGSVDDYAPVQQQTCGQLKNQQWTLRPSYNANQLGEAGAARYRVEAATSPDRVLDVTDCHTEQGSDVRMWNWVDGSPCQGWKLDSLGDDVYKIIDPHSGMALDIQGCAKVPRGTSDIETSNESECQKWRIEPSPDGSYSVTAVSTGLSLDVAGCDPAAGADVITWLYHGGACQRWFFKKL